MIVIIISLNIELTRRSHAIDWNKVEFKGVNNKAVPVKNAKLQRKKDNKGILGNKYRPWD